MCPCSCLVGILLNMTSDQLLEETTRLQSHLSVDVTSLSSNVRKKNCAQDDRTSAQAMGSSAIVILVVSFGVLVLQDLPELYKLANSIKDNVVQWL